MTAEYLKQLTFSFNKLSKFFGVLSTPSMGFIISALSILISVDLFSLIMKSYCETRASHKIAYRFETGFWTRNADFEIATQNVMSLFGTGASQRLFDHLTILAIL